MKYLYLLTAGIVISTCIFCFENDTLDAKTVKLEKMVALTFDDGPYGTSTASILQILEQKKVPATFFLIGKNVKKYPAEVKKEIADGDVIGNHSYSHSRLLPKMSTSTLAADISLAENLIFEAAGVRASLFRAPYSATSPQMIKEIKREGYTIAGWTIDPEDWNNTNSSTTIISSVLKKVKSNAIIILHDGHERGSTYARDNTIEALPVIIDNLKVQGYKFVTVDKILSK